MKLDSITFARKMSSQIFVVSTRIIMALTGS